MPVCLVALVDSCLFLFAKVWLNECMPRGHHVITLRDQPPHPTILDTNRKALASHLSYTSPLQNIAMNGAPEVTHAPSNGHGANGISNQAGPSNIYASPAPSSPTDASRAPAVFTAPELTAEQVNQRFVRADPRSCCVVDSILCSRHAEISAHIYHTGFQLGQYADVSLVSRAQGTHRCAALTSVQTQSTFTIGNTVCTH